MRCEVCGVGPDKPTAYDFDEMLWLKMRLRPDGVIEVYGELCVHYSCLYAETVGGGE